MNPPYYFSKIFDTIRLLLDGSSIEVYYNHFSFIYSGDILECNKISQGKIIR